LLSFSRSQVILGNALTHEVALRHFNARRAAEFGSSTAGIRHSQVELGNEKKDLVERLQKRRGIAMRVHALWHQLNKWGLT
jgi:hypothetical protein